MTLLTADLSHGPLNDVPHMSAGRQTDEAGLFISNSEGDNTELSVDDDCDMIEGDGVGNWLDGKTEGGISWPEFRLVVEDSKPRVLP